MAVYTEVSFDEAQALFDQLDAGQVQGLRGIPGGIENTNYFVDVLQSGKEVEYVLTVFERLTHEQLPYYLELMRHLARGGIPAPCPLEDKNGRILHSIGTKPATIVNKLSGHSELNPTPAHCAAMGNMLARMHLAGSNFLLEQANLRGLNWWNATMPAILPFLKPSQSSLLASELAYQNHVAASSGYAALPRGAIHADLFRDNVMFTNDKLTGVFDFYFAGTDAWLFDLAVCLNDWCVDMATGKHQPTLAQSFLTAYQAVRSLTAAERLLLPAMLRAGALRFWISRLWDFHLPREASMLKPHDPAHLERVLWERVSHAPHFP